MVITKLELKANLGDKIAEDIIPIDDIIELPADIGFEIKDCIWAQETGLTDYKGMIFKGRIEDRKIKGYGSFIEFYEGFFIPAEIKCPEPYK